MRPLALLSLALLLCAAPLTPLAAQAQAVSEKKDLAVFALGCYGWSIPLEALGGIDTQIQKVFEQLGRFTVIGKEQRLSPWGLTQFIDALQWARQSGVVIPERFQFGEAILTKEEFDKLLAAFIVAVPFVVDFASSYDERSGYYITTITTSVSFIDVDASGSVLAVAKIESSGMDKYDQSKSIRYAIDSIPMFLQYEIRKIPAFQIKSRVLSAAGSEITMQLGKNMGIRKGDEYTMLKAGADGAEERETGLLVVKDVGSDTARGAILYAENLPARDTRLREVPRLGFDAEPFFHFVSGVGIAVGGVEPETPHNYLVGLRMPVSRGFYGFRPYVGIQVPANAVRGIGTVFLFPFNVIIGSEYRLNLRRLSITPYFGIGLGYVYVSEAISGASRDSSGSFFPHVGGQIYLNIAWLLSKSLRVFVEAGAEYWFGLADWLYSSYGGYGLGAGISVKL